MVNVIFREMWLVEEGREELSEEKFARCHVDPYCQRMSELIVGNRGQFMKSVLINT